MPIDFEKRLTDALAGKDRQSLPPEEIVVRLRQAERAFRKALRQAMHTLIRHRNHFKEWSKPDGEFFWYTSGETNLYITLSAKPIPEQARKIDIDVIVRPNSGAESVLYQRAYAIHSRNWDDVEEIAQGLTLGIASFYADKAPADTGS